MRSGSVVTNLDRVQVKLDREDVERERCPGEADYQLGSNGVPELYQCLTPDDPLVPVGSPRTVG